MRSCVLAAVAVGLLLGVGKPREKKSDKNLIEGTWQLVSLERDGMKDARAAGTAEFRGGKLTLRLRGVPVRPCTYKLGETKTPKTIDLTAADAPPDAPRAVQGIYELKGETLRLCIGPPDKGRPAKLDVKGNLLMTFKRA